MLTEASSRRSRRARARLSILYAGLQACRSVEDVEHLYEAAHTKFVKHQATAKAKIEGREGREQRACACRPQMQDAAKGFIGKLQDAFYGKVMAPKVDRGAHLIPPNRNVIVVAGTTRSTPSTWRSCGTPSARVPAADIDLARWRRITSSTKGSSARSSRTSPTSRRSTAKAARARACVRRAPFSRRARLCSSSPRGRAARSGEIQRVRSRSFGHLALTHGVDILPVYLGRHVRERCRGAPPLPTRARDHGAHRTAAVRSRSPAP